MHPLLLALDFETTGLGRGALPTEIGAYHPGGSFSETIAVPKGTKISSWVTENMGFTEEALSASSSPQEVGARFTKWLEGQLATGQKARIVGYNAAEADLPHLRRLLGDESFERLIDPEVVDVLPAAQAQRAAQVRTAGFATRASNKLQSVAQDLGVAEQIAHRGMPDARATWNVMEKLRAMGFDASALPAARRGRSTADDLARHVVGLSPNTLGWVAGGLLTYAFLSGRRHGAEIEGLRSATSSWDKVHGIDLSPEQKSMVPFGSGRDLMRQLLQEVPNDRPWVRGSALGLYGPDITERYEAGSQYRIDNSSATAVGDSYHLMLQRQLLGLYPGAQAEVEITDWVNRFTGHVDVLLPGNIPLEIKSVADDRALSRLREPKPAAQSQINAYMLTLGAPYGFVLYGTRGEGSETRLFRVYPDAALYQEDLARLRAQILSMGADVRSDNGQQKSLDAFWDLVRQPSWGNTAQMGAVSPAFEPASQYWGVSPLQSQVRSQHARIYGAHSPPTAHAIGSRRERGGM